MRLKWTKVPECKIKNLQIITQGRTRVIADVNVEEGEYPIFEGRGNLSFTTINLPRLGIKHGILSEEEDLDGFFEELGEKMDIAKEQLLDRYKMQVAKSPENFPFLIGQNVALGSEDTKAGDLSAALKHGSLSIGFIGLAETLTALIGEHHGESEEAQELGLEIIEFMRERTDRYAKEEGLNFSLLATPAEGLSGRFVAIDRERFGEIKGITDKEYYTNSFHIPVGYDIKAGNKVAIEGPYHQLTNAGHITYVELDGDLITNSEAVMSVIRMMKDAGIGYGAINHPLDRDPVCGFSGVIGDVCPGCNRTEADGVPFERIRRITGYLVGTTDRFNDAKQAEERDRVKHGKA